MAIVGSDVPARAKNKTLTLMITSERSLINLDPQ